MNAPEKLSIYLIQAAEEILKVAFDPSGIKDGGGNW